MPTHKQQYIKEKLTLWNTIYIQIGKNIQEQATIRKKCLPNERHYKKESPP